jgi:hypothetical protein
MSLSCHGFFIKDDYMPTLKFQREIGDKVDTFDRNLIIIDREIRPKIAHKNGKPYNLNQKFYKYKCLDCGNEDWSVEYALGEKMHCGCNACCHPPKKVVVGVNDITTTAPWMVKYFPKGITEAQKYTKYSNEIVELVCPDCGRVYKKQIKAFCSAKTLACVCGDGISYPNKYMYALLEQLKICFEKEKTFSWSESKRYDFYINDNEIIVEMNGKQHYSKPINPKARTLEEEQENDRYKRKIAFENGIDKYFSIDCSESDGDFIKNNIIKSGLLESLNVFEEQINWKECDEFATSNLVKAVCEYKKANPHLTISEIAKHFKTAYGVVQNYIKKGAKLGWCTYDINESRQILESQNRIDHRQKPIYCITNDTYYRSSGVAEKSLSTPRQTFYSRQIRKSIQREQNYLNHKFIYITRAKFNEATILYPTKTVGNPFR